MKTLIGTLWRSPNGHLWRIIRQTPRILVYQGPRGVVIGTAEEHWEDVRKGKVVKVA